MNGKTMKLGNAKAKGVATKGDRGKIRFQKSQDGQADYVQVGIREADGSYTWQRLVTLPLVEAPTTEVEAPATPVAARPSFARWNRAPLGAAPIVTLPKVETPTPPISTPDAPPTIQFHQSEAPKAETAPQPKAEAPAPPKVAEVPAPLVEVPAP